MGHKYTQHNSTVVGLRVPNEALAFIDSIARAKGVKRTALIREWMSRGAAQDQKFLTASSVQPRNSGDQE